MADIVADGAGFVDDDTLAGKNACSALLELPKASRCRCGARISLFCREILNEKCGSRIRQLFE